MGLVHNLEEKLKNYFKNAQSLRSYNDWLGWLTASGVPIEKLSKSDKNSGTEKINYQKFLGLIEEHIKFEPKMIEKLVDPYWLFSHKLTISPEIFTKLNDNAPKKIAYLMSEVKQLKMHLKNIESSIESKISLGLNNAQTDGGSKESDDASGVSDALKKVKTEYLQNKNLSRAQIEKQAIIEKSKDKEEDEETTISLPSRLEDTYFSIENWWQILIDGGYNLSQFNKDQVDFSSQHKISFTQFVTRAKRQLESNEAKAQFALVVDGFNTAHPNGLEAHETPNAENKNNPKNVIDEPKVNSTSGKTSNKAKNTENNVFDTSSMPDIKSSGFKRPSDEIYLEFNLWLNWLKENGIDPNQYASEELEVASSHQISFAQFIKRLGRKLDNEEAFLQKVQ